MNNYSKGSAGRISLAAVACAIALSGCFDGGAVCPAYSATGYHVYLECPSAHSFSDVQELAVRVRRTGADGGASQRCPAYYRDGEVVACGSRGENRVAFLCTHGAETDDGTLGLIPRGEGRLEFELEASFIDATGRAWQGASRVVWRETSNGCFPISEDLTIEMAPASSP